MPQSYELTTLASFFPVFPLSMTHKKQKFRGKTDLFLTFGSFVLATVRSSSLTWVMYKVSSCWNMLLLFMGETKHCPDYAIRINSIAPNTMIIVEVSRIQALSTSSVYPMHSVTENQPLTAGYLTSSRGLYPY